MTDDASGTPPDPLAALLARWQRDEDRSALDELLQAEIGHLKQRIRARGESMLHDSLSVSDVAQEAVLRLLEVAPTPRFETTKGLRAYLWTSAWRLLLAQLRRPERGRRARNDSQTGGFENLLATTGGLGRIDEADRAAALRFVIGLLEPDEQVILDAVYFRELGIEGAARELALSHDAAKMRLSRARRRLAKKLVKWIELIG